MALDPNSAVARPAFPGDLDDSPLGELWVPRTDAAALSPKSLDTVNRAIRGNDLRLREGPAKTKYVFLPDLAALDLVPAHVIETPGNTSDAAELARARDQILDLRVRLARAEGRVELKDELIDTLTKELDKTGKLLGSLARANENLAGRRTAVDLR